jgi:zinc/manganese transport system permease protein
VSVSSASLIASGFFANEAVHTAALIGAVAAIVSGAVGVFTVMRAQAFAGEALGDISSTGGSAALLAGVAPLSGIVAIDVAAVAAMELIGIQRPRGRDLATGIVLGAALGLSSLLLYIDTTQHSTTGVVVTILFGSIFTIAHSTILPAALFSAAALALVALLYRPLLLSSVSAEIAAARGVRVRLVGAGYLLALAMAVSLAAITIGTTLSTALLIGPAATALRLTARPGRAIAMAVAIAAAAVWLGVLLAYDSFYWPPHGTGWPVSFFVVALVFLAYLTSGLPALLRRRARA